MKKVVYVLLVFLLGCSKNDRDTNESTVEYQVTATNASLVAAAYVNETKNTVGATIQSGWKYSFKTVEKPFTVYLKAVGSNIDYRVSVSTTAKILINGVVKIQKTETGGGSAIAEIQYVIE